MIEPQQLTAARMSRNGRADCTRPQSVAVLPGNLNLMPATMLFDHCLVGGLKYRLPGQAQAVAEIPNVHPMFARKTFPDFRIESLINLAHIGDRCLAAVAGRRVTEKENFQRPGLLI